MDELAREIEIHDIVLFNEDRSLELKIEFYGWKVDDINNYIQTHYEKNKRFTDFKFVS